MHVGINAVNSWGKGKYIIFMIPCFLIFFSCAVKFKYIENKYFWGPSAAILMRVFLFGLQLLCLFFSIKYFSVLLDLTFGN
ncbi:hypothetical protein FD46_GL001246 [Liquorilactobacillus oeni DSM 19972]|uniref:Uncharacterized protein n=2 Tax=Liquorilactobacillus oeni TaxID=303241 RepID=A0A0R1M872_9LACO|nr:hypothetical protein FD46_GL001246 [Liquorilactobacillus oeni DSM 19972]